MSIGKRMKNIKQAGETIVEVLLCVAVITFTLSIGYGLARRSQQTIRQAEERGQATQFAQQQIERFKQYLKTNSTITTKKSLPSDTGTILPNNADAGFCFYKDVSIHYVAGGIGSDVGPKNPICALNVSGEFYCDPSAPQAGCPSAMTSSTVDSAGYIYRAGIAYFPPGGNFGAPGAKLNDQFYANSGVFSVGDTTNTQEFTVVTLPYRIHQ